MEHQVKLKTTETLIANLTSVSDQTRISSLCELRILTKSDPNIRPVITTHNDGAAISLLAENLYSSTQIVQVNAAVTLLNISISCKDKLISAHGVLDSLAYVLANHRTGPPEAVQAAAATIYSFTVEESCRCVIGGKREIVRSLAGIVGFRESPLRSVKDGLKALFGLALCGPNRSVLVGFGAVEVLFGVVKDCKGGVVEDATAVIAQIVGCEESVGVVRKCCGVRVLVELLDSSSGSGSSSSSRSSLRSKENVVSGLLNLVKVGGEEVGEEIREVGLGLVFDGLGEVVDCGSDKGKKRAQALIKILEDGMSFKGGGGNYSGSGSDLFSGPSLDSSNSYSYSF